MLQRLHNNFPPTFGFNFSVSFHRIFQNNSSLIVSFFRAILNIILLNKTLLPQVCFSSLRKFSYIHCYINKLILFSRSIIVCLHLGKNVWLQLTSIGFQFRILTFAEINNFLFNSIKVSSYLNSSKVFILYKISEFN